MVHGYTLKQGSQAILYSVGVASLAATFLNGDEVGTANFLANIIQFGAPVAVGAAAANIYPGNLGADKKLSDYFTRGLVAGGVAAGVLIGAGALPLTLDLQTLSLVGLAGVSVIAGEALSNAVSGI